MTEDERKLLIKTAETVTVISWIISKNLRNNLSLIEELSLVVKFLDPLIKKVYPLAGYDDNEFLKS